MGMKALAVRWGLENGEAGRVCESGLGCDALPLSAQTPAFGATLSSAGTTGCASHGASLFLVWPRKSNQKEGHPYIRVLLRKTSLASARLRGSSRRAIPGPSLLARHPCLATPYATPTLSLLKGARDRVVWEFLNSDGSKALQPLAGFVGWKTAKHFPPQSTQRLVSNVARKNRWVSFALPTLRSLEGRTSISLHGLSGATESPLSGGRAQVAWKGLSGMDAARAAMGQGWPFAAGPWSVTGAREPRRSRGRMEGQAFLLTFFAFEKSESPCKAKPVDGAEESAASDARLRATSGRERSAVSHPTTLGQARTRKAHLNSMQSAKSPYLRPSLTGAYKTPRVMVPPC